MTCVFCRLVDGAVPSRTVYRDDDVIAFLDANPLAAGHTLVMPVDHHERLEDLTTPLARTVWEVVHRLLEPVQDAVGADATTVAVNNGRTAGQEVPHVHCHIVPRFEEDGGGPIHAAMGPRPRLADDELRAIADSIASASS